MSVKNIIFFFGIILSVPLWAKTTSVTLQSADRDKITVKYDVTVNKDGTATIVIQDVKPRLGWNNGDKYREQEKVKVLFFDKNGGHNEYKVKSDITTDALMVSSNEISYSSSQYGIVWLDERPEINLKLHTDSSSLSIPVYLAYYEKKHTYKVFASCGNLTIPLSLPRNEAVADGLKKEKVIRTLTTTEEIEEETVLSDNDQAMLLINQIQKLLDESSSSCMPDGIDFYKGELLKLRLTITDRDVLTKISDLFGKIEERKLEVASSTSMRHKQDKADAEADEARQNMNYLNERLDNISKLSENDVADMLSRARDLRSKSYSVSDEKLASEMKSVADRCDEAANKIDKSKKRRNVWLIIGGILLTIIMFVGNQFFQHFRNLRSQKGIEEMQARIAKQAESDAKRRVRGLVHNHMAKARNAARGKAVKAVNSSINNVTKGKGKKVSI